MIVHFYVVIIVITNALEYLPAADADLASIIISRNDERPMTMIPIRIAIDLEHSTGVVLNGCPAVRLQEVGRCAVSGCSKRGRWDVHVGFSQCFRILREKPLTVGVNNAGV